MDSVDDGPPEDDRDYLLNVLEECEMPVLVAVETVPTSNDSVDDGQDGSNGGSSNKLATRRRSSPPTLTQRLKMVTKARMIRLRLPKPRS